MRVWGFYYCGFICNAQSERDRGVIVRETEGGRCVAS